MAKLDASFYSPARGATQRHYRAYNCRLGVWLHLFATLLIGFFSEFQWAMIEK